MVAPGLFAAISTPLISSCMQSQARVWPATCEGDPEEHTVVLEMRCCGGLNPEGMHNGLVAQVGSVCLCRRGAMSGQVEGQLLKSRCQSSVNGR